MAKATGGGNGPSKAIVKVFRKAMSADAKGKPYTAQREQLEALRQGLDEKQWPLVERAWQLFDDFRHPHKRLDVQSCIAEMTALVAGGQGGVASVLLERMGSILKDCTLGDLAPCFESSLAVTQYCKYAKIKPQRCSEYVRGNAESAYLTVLGEWAVEHVPVGKLGSVIPLLLRGAPRPGRAMAPDAVLRRLVESDKRADLVKRYLAKPAITEPEALRLSMAIVSASPSGLVWPTAIAGWLRGPGLVERKQRFVQCLEEALQVRGGGGAGRVSAFAAAIVANMANLEDPAKEPERQRVSEIMFRLADGTCHAASSSSAQGLWYCARTTSDRKPRGVGAEGMSVGTATHLSLALRNKEAGSDAAQILDALGSNLGLVPLGEKDAEVEFDPEHFEDLQGGLMPGMAARVVACGWVWNQQVILRARVVQR